MPDCGRALVVGTPEGRNAHDQARCPPAFVGHDGRPCPARSGGRGRVTYGLLTGDAWASNVFTQVLISIGYFPTIQNLLTEKRNVESFTGWGCAVVAGLIALYPAIVDGNSLAILYALRTVVFVSSIIAVMVYYELRSKKTRWWA
jgi:hypothetical protein